MTTILLALSLWLALGCCAAWVVGRATELGATPEEADGAAAPRRG